MDFSDLFKNSFKYPVSNLKNFFIFAVVILVAQILYGIGYYFINNPFGSLFNILGFIVGFFILGYIISVIRRSIYLDNNLPEFDFQEDLMLGLKAIIVEIVYYIIPIIILLVVALLTGLFDLCGMLINSAVYGNSIPESILSNYTISIIFFIIVAIILGVIFTFFNIVGLSRLAKYDSISEALNISQVLRDIKAIGIFDLFAYLIVLILINLIIMIIGGFIAIIPVVGAIIINIIFIPFVYLFTARVFGLIYSEISE